MAIDSFRGEYAFLSNFHPSPVSYMGLMYPTVEHAYQAAKTMDNGTRLLIASLSTPGKAKRFGATLEKRADWFQMSLQVMKQLLQEKFHVHPDLKQKLLDTGDQELVEGNTWGDTFWGMTKGFTGQWEGQNHLGILLMEVRDDLKTAQKLSLAQSVIDNAKSVLTDMKAKFSKKPDSEKE